YNGPGNYGDCAKAIDIDNNGNVYVAGTSYGENTGYDYATIKYDTDGNLLWVRRYNGLGNGNDDVSAIAIDNNNNVYVTGRSYGENTGYDYATIKYDTDGNLLWVRRYNGLGNGNDGASAIAIDNNGNVYVTGYSYDSLTMTDYTTIKYDKDGNELWVRKYDGPASGYDYACKIVTDDSGNIFVTGIIANPYLCDYCTIKYDKNGNELWVRMYNGSKLSNDIATAIAVDYEGNVYVTGYSWEWLTYQADYVTIKYDKDGNELWIRRYDGPDNYFDNAHAISVDKEGNVYVTGFSFASGTFDDFTTIKYDKDGNELWVRRYNGPTNRIDRANAIVLDNFGNVYVTGESENYNTDTTYLDYATVKYDKDGNELWVMRYNGPANHFDWATSIVVDNENNIYVTGGSYGYGSYSDYATIKYVQRVPIINQEKENNIEKKLIKRNKIYDITGKIIKEKKLKKGIYFKEIEKGIKKILILR
ncbi:MAG: SBBP repeat-containing protein, partial [candidate division WOR-3 bacterium]